jgi:hypothetical protein
MYSMYSTVCLYVYIFEQVVPPTSGQTAGFSLAHEMTKIQAQVNILHIRGLSEEDDRLPFLL